jgi:hypothetical protein
LLSQRGDANTEQGFIVKPIAIYKKPAKSRHSPGRHILKLAEQYPPAGALQRSTPVVGPVKAPRTGVEHLAIFLQVPALISIGSGINIDYRDVCERIKALRS